MKKGKSFITRTSKKIGVRFVEEIVLLLVSKGGPELNRGVKFLLCLKRVRLTISRVRFPYALWFQHLLSHILSYDYRPISDVVV